MVVTRSTVYHFNPEPLVSSTAKLRDGEDPPVISGTSCRQHVGLLSAFVFSGFIMGFFSYLQIPICFYVFGPVPENVSYAQCNTAHNVEGLPFVFKLFLALVADRVHLFGSRRKGWLILGMTGALCVLVVLAFCTVPLVRLHMFFTYTMLCTLCSLFLAMSEVAAQALTLELSQLEPEDVRGSLLSLTYMAKSGSGLITKVLVLLSMNGPSYSGPNSTGVFPFELPFWSVHLVLVAIALPLVVVVVVELKEPALDSKPHLSTTAIFGKLWVVVRSKVSLFIFLGSVLSISLGGLRNPVTPLLGNIIGVSTLWTTLGGFSSTLCFIFGTHLFRNYLINVNWRITKACTKLVSVVANVGTFFMIYDFWGIVQTGWFFALGPSVELATLVIGMDMLLLFLPIIELAPSGLEASTYELFMTVVNGSSSLSQALGNMLLPIFDLNGITSRTYHAPSAPVDRYNSLMARATWIVIAANGLSLLLYIGLVPKSKRQTRAWHGDARWHGPIVGGMGVLIAISALLLGTTLNFLSMIPSTRCLRIAGGDGC